MEELVTDQLCLPRGTLPSPAFWRRRRVLVTGHSGFIGGWLCAWLIEMGAEVTGFALAPAQPSFHDDVRLGERMRGLTGDVRDTEAVSTAFIALRPEIVLHLAAQAFVGIGHAAPVETFATNVMGTVNVLDAIRRCGVAAAVVMTSDKVYCRPATPAAHAESDPLGGGDPYGGSKACCEFAAQAYADSYLTAAGVGTATVRAGNVVGGGDWGRDRLIPDAVRAFSESSPLHLRHPDAVRPWQHVLDAVSGLLLIAERAWRSRTREAWNIGPIASGVTVRQIAGRFAAAWGDDATISEDGSANYPEAGFLGLDSSRARRELSWSSPWDIGESIARTADWYKTALGGGDAWSMTLDQIRAYGQTAGTRAAKPAAA